MQNPRIHSLGSANACQNQQDSSLSARVLIALIRPLVCLVTLHLLPSAAVPQTIDRPFFGVTLRSSVLEQRFSRQRSEEEPVSKILLNTNVTGSQSTVTETRLRILPDSNAIRFELINSGDVTSRTTGVNPQAKIDSTGHHHFDIVKPMSFDGTRFLTVPCHGTIQASQKPDRVVSAASAAMPLLGRLGDQIAWNEVLRRQPEIDRAVALDVSRDVLPKIDRLIDSDFARLGKQWRSARSHIGRAFEQSRLQWFARSSDAHIAIWAQATSSDRTFAPVSRSSTSVELQNNEEIVVYVSDNAIASLIRQHVPKGLKITDTQLQQLQQSTGGAAKESFSLAQLFALWNELRLSAPDEAALFTIELASEHPVEVKFDDGDVKVATTFQIHPKIGASSGWLTTTFNLRGKGVPDDRWAVVVRSVDVGEITDEESGVLSEPEFDSSVRSSVPFLIPNADSSENPEIPDDSTGSVVTVETGTGWMTVVQSAAESLAEKLPPVTLPLEFEASGFAPGIPRMRLSRIESAHGVLRVSLQIAEQCAVDDPSL